MKWTEILKDEKFLKDIAFNHKALIIYLKGEVVVEFAEASRGELKDDKEYEITDETGLFMSLFMQARTPKGYRLAISIMETEKDEYTHQLSLNGQTKLLSTTRGERQTEGLFQAFLETAYGQYTSGEW